MSVPGTCLIANHHPLLLDAICRKVEDAGFDVTAMTADGQAALDLLLELHPDIAVIDLRLRGIDGLEVLARLEEAGSNTRTLITSATSSPLTLQRIMDAGACGCLGTDFTGDVLVEAIRAVAAGRRYMDSTLAGSMYGRPTYALSVREMEVLKLLALGMSNKEIATEMATSADTAKSHVSAVLGKLGVTSRSGAIAIAFREQLVPSGWPLG